MAKKIKTIKAESIKKSNAKIKPENLPVKVNTNIQSMANMPMNVVDLNPQQLIALAIQNNSSVDVMKQLYEFSRQIKADKAKEVFFQEMAAFQAECPPIKKTKPVYNEDGSLRYKFAPIESIEKQIKPFKEKHGFSHTMDSEQTENTYVSIISVNHIMGHTEKHRFEVPSNTGKFMNDIQKRGDARSYANRYNLCNAYGLTTADIDSDAVYGEMKMDLLETVKIKISDKVLNLSNPNFKLNLAKEKTDILGMAQSIRRSLNPDEIKYFQNLRDDKKEFTMDSLKKELLNLSEIIDAEMKKAEENSKMDNEKKSLISELDGVLVICRKDIRDFNQAKELSIKTNFIPESDIKLSSKENIRKLVEHLKDMVLNNEANKNKS
jgi:hypothetical protein